MRVVQLFPGETLPPTLDEEGVQPEEEGAVIISLGNSLGGAVEHKLGVFVHPGWGCEGHADQVPLLVIVPVAALVVGEARLADPLSPGVYGKGEV